MSALLFNAGLYAGSTALLRLAGFTAFLWMASRMPVDEYAVFGLLYALQSALAMFASAGVAEAAVGGLDGSASPEVKRSHFASARRAGLGMACLSVVIGVVGVWILGSRGISLRGCGAAGLSGLLMAFGSLEAQLTRLDERPFASTYFSFLTPLLALGTGVGCFAWKRTPESYFEGSALGASIPLLARSLPGILASRTDGYGTTRVIARAMPFVSAAGVGWLGGYGITHAVDLFFDRTEVARFAFLLTLCSVMLMVAGSLNQAWMPRFLALLRERGFIDVERANREVYRVLALALGSVGGLMLLGYPVLLRALGGQLGAYESLSLELALMFAGYVLGVPRWHCDQHFLARSRGGRVLKASVLAGLAGFGATLLLMRELGPRGAYAGFALQMLFRSCAAVRIAGSEWPLTVSWGGVLMGLTAVAWGLALTHLSWSLLAAMVAYTLPVGAAFIWVRPRALLSSSGAP